MTRSAVLRVAEPEAMLAAAELESLCFALAGGGQHPLDVSEIFELGKRATRARINYAMWTLVLKRELVFDATSEPLRFFARESAAADKEGPAARAA